MFKRKSQRILCFRIKYSECHKMVVYFMSILYTTIEKLCAEKGISVTQLCKESGASRASLTDLKKGRKQSLSTETLLKIASYFGVSVDYLLGNTDKKEKAPAEEGGGITDEELKFALFDAPEEITDDIMDEVKRFAKYVEEQRRNGHIK